MKNKALFFIVLLLAMFAHKGIAQPQLPYGNAVLPVYFHFSTTNTPGNYPSAARLQVAYDYVCAVNKYFGRNNGLKVAFFVGGVDQGTCGSPSIAKGINVYIGVCPPCASGSPGCTNGTVINLNGVVSDIVFVHEMGHALSLGHPESGPCPFFKIFSPNPYAVWFDNGSDCIADTYISPLDNWMNSGTPAGYGAVLTPYQKSVAAYALMIRTGKDLTPPQDNWNLYNTGPALTASVDPIVPLPKLEGLVGQAWAEVRHGTLSFFTDISDCNSEGVNPDYIVVEVHTFCGAHRILTYQILDYTQPVAIDICWGIDYIVYKYYYGGQLFTRTINYNYNYPNSVQTAQCPCEEQTNDPKDPEMRGSSLPNQSQRENSIIVTVGHSLKYNNEGYAKYVISNMTGSKVANGDLLVNGEIQIEDFPAGIYIFKAFANDGKSKVIKFTK